MLCVPSLLYVYDGSRRGSGWWVVARCERRTTGLPTSLSPQSFTGTSLR